MKIEATIIAVAGVAILLQSDLKATFTTHLHNTLLPFLQTILASSFFSITFTIAKLLVAIFLLRKLFLICYAPWTIIGFDEYKKVTEKGTYTPGASSVNSKDKRILGKFPHPYPTGWYKITDSVKLKKGDVQYHQALGQHLVLFRTEEGIACILDAYCPHLGANLGIDGRVVGNCVECAFHAWRFNGHTGKCDEIPYNPSSCTIPPQAKVKAWNVEECNGSIYMWFCADEEPPSWKVFETPEIEDKSYSFLGKFEQMIDAHIQEIPENGADLAHLNFLHAPAVLSPIKALQHHWSLSWDLGEGPEEHSTSIHIVQKVLFNGNAIPGTTVGVKVRQYGPSLVKLELCMPFGRFIVMENVTPVGPLRQKVSHCFWAPKGVFFRVLGKFCMLAFYKQFTRDLIVWNNKKYVHNPLVVKNDGPILQFRRWFSRFYPKQEWKGEEERPTVDPQKLEW